MLNWRSLVAPDVPATLTMCEACIGDEYIGRAAAIDVWRGLTSRRSFGSALVDSAASNGESRPIAVGAAVFVTRAFADQEIAEPEPGLNARLIRGIHEGKPVVLTDSGLQAGNAGDGLDLVILCAAWRPEVTPTELAELEAVLAAAFFQRFAGWRFRHLIREGADRAAIAHIESQRIFGTKHHFVQFRRHHPDSAWNAERALFICTREHALAVPGSVASILFGYREPILRLPPHAQELLTAAMTGITDEELARSLDLKLATVKKRWSTIFSHVSAVRPDLWPHHEGEVDRGRGPQKRHRLLDYLRAHPEELRPYVRSARRGARRGDVTS
jgi:hypothetical protein